MCVKGVYDFYIPNQNKLSNSNSNAIFSMFNVLTRNELKWTVWRFHSRTDFKFWPISHIKCQRMIAWHQRQPIRAEHRLGCRHRFTTHNFRTQLTIEPDENLVLLFLLISGPKKDRLMVSFSKPLQDLADFEHQMAIQNLTLLQHSGAETLFNWLTQWCKYTVTMLVVVLMIGNTSRFFSTGGLTSSPLCPARVEMHWLKVGKMMIPGFAFCSV